MKYFILLAATLFCSCAQDKPEVTAPVTVSVVIDVTDTQKYWVSDATDILRLFHCKTSPDNECLYRCRTIEDKRLTPITTIQLPASDNRFYDDDPQFRAKQIKAFYKSVAQSLQLFHTTHDTATASLSRSECFHTIASELTVLSKIEGERMLIVNSNLAENSGILRLANNPTTTSELIAKTFEDTHLLPKSLQGITVYYIYSPVTRDEDKAFGVVSSAYLTLLTKRGAIVRIQTKIYE